MTNQHILGKQPDLFARKVRTSLDRDVLLPLRATYCATALTDRRRWKKARDAFQKFRESLADDGWRSPDVDCSLFIRVPDTPGIYLLLAINRVFHDNGFVAYIGMSKRLVRRIGAPNLSGVGHPIIREIEADGFSTQRWIKPADLDSLREQERFYIGRFDPPYNIIGRRRGLI